MPVYGMFTTPCVVLWGGGGVLDCLACVNPAERLWLSASIEVAVHTVDTKEEVQEVDNAAHYACDYPLCCSSNWAYRPDALEALPALQAPRGSTGRLRGSTCSTYCKTGIKTEGSGEAQSEPL